MNKFAYFVLGTMITALSMAVAFGLKYSQASLIFAAIAALLAPVAVHKVKQTSTAATLLLCLSVFASFPVKKLFQVDTYSQQVALPAIYLAALWLIGAGWKRSWK